MHGPAAGLNAVAPPVDLLLAHADGPREGGPCEAADLLQPFDALGEVLRQPPSLAPSDFSRPREPTGNVSPAHQIREERAISLFVSRRTTEVQLDDQRKFITERLESVRAMLDKYRARAASGAKKRR